MCAKSTQDCRKADPSAVVCFHQADIGEYLRARRYGAREERVMTPIRTKIIYICMYVYVCMCVCVCTRYLVRVVKYHPGS